MRWLLRWPRGHRHSALTPPRLAGWLARTGWLAGSPGPCYSMLRTPPWPNCLCWQGTLVRTGPKVVKSGQKWPPGTMRRLLRWPSGHPGLGWLAGWLAGWPADRPCGGCPDGHLRGPGPEPLASKGSLGSEHREACSKVVKMGHSGPWGPRLAGHPSRPPDGPWPAGQRGSKSGHFGPFLSRFWPILYLFLIQLKPLSWWSKDKSDGWPKTGKTPLFDHFCHAGRQTPNDFKGQPQNDHFLTHYGQLCVSVVALPAGRILPLKWRFKGVLTTFAQNCQF